ncbi:hypothetical protein E4T42_03875 [Aureobasidium subglaciale]|uniref:Uncharacterized protein n=1 Tax=Aureobasidium subglaciale (strain EXF-2481) TaxID=1043005 RepID=A0A074YEB6_AURSE|nr:uncharacterized protein AUEXF2481DRAFT_5903 [Aureobasidium subglaciale EXF-2481]KAI5209762.1 hypothetical protein E4T38_02302 [Aureobasidium subglaciale]KAI5228493.1 hypothetical protein E4T40_02081 [Aureobasidium subglaciale]KAI5232043.1 hypothetical protein E4T41_02301 [Aureobasidium subglaciale]KAI5251909.1 hypothetical protein E4T42_03875 [Aureobasidium subglaciale]KAI5265776.1 hypothetical protein E4T46_02079 [Aureobasidium subglaciale]
MAKTKSKKSPKSSSLPKESPEQLYDLAIQCVETSEPQQALEHAQNLLVLVRKLQTPNAVLPALNLLGEISIELGDADAARDYFMQAVEADPEGAIPEAVGGGAEKFLWMAQLCEEGGAASVAWFERGAKVLKREIGELEAVQERDETAEVLLEEKRGKLANALCGVVEVYMTDLSWEADAEQRCENLITEAMMVDPESPEVLQTLASVRLSQLKPEDARAALTRSISMWKDLEPEDPTIPDFPTRVSLARLLMEADMEEEAMDVLERLALEDDQSVEACYLGGWCLQLMADKKKTQFGDAIHNAESEQAKELLATLRASRSWLLNTLRLYRVLEYEDERLKQHTEELVDAQCQVLGPPPEEGKEDDEDDEWEGIDEDDEAADGDEEMAGM